MKSIERLNKDRQNKERIKEKLASFDFLAKINFILARMKETNIGIVETHKPEEKKEKLSVERVIFPNEGGVYTYCEGVPYPAKGFCFGEIVETVDMIKKIAMGVFKAFYDSLKGNKLKVLIMVLFFRKPMKTLAIYLIREFDGSIGRVRLKPDKYCTSGREIYRVFNLLIKWYQEWAIDLACFRNLVCMVWEFDDAYRYTLQDVFEDINKEALRKKPVKELSRILDIIAEREITETTTGKVEDTRVAWKFQKIKRLLFLLYFMPKTKKAVKRFFLELDLDKIKMDEADRYHASQKPGYNWRYQFDGTTIIKNE